jgi:hypothetical protein
VINRLHVSSVALHTEKIQIKNHYNTSDGTSGQTDILYYPEYITCPPFNNQTNKENIPYFYYRNGINTDSYDNFFVFTIFHCYFLFSIIIICSQAIDSIAITAGAAKVEVGMYTSPLPQEMKISEFFTYENRQ